MATSLRSGNFSFSPTRRVLIPKPGKKELRPLSVGSPREKIVQKAITIVLEEIWEKKFSPNSYGFRPKKNLHQALYQIYRNGSAYNWVIQGDISKCFDMIPHSTILNIIQNKIKCDKTVQLVNKSLKAGYIDPKTGEHITSKLGTPQGSILSPLLANIVLNQLDKQVENIKPKYETGKKRGINKVYDAITSKTQNIQKFKPGSSEVRKLANMRRKIPSMDVLDPNFKRLMYLRYADDFVVLVIGSKDDTINIKLKIANALRLFCGLELNVDKTLITATKTGFSFLGA